MKKFNLVTLFAGLGLLVGAAGCGGNNANPQQPALGYVPGSIIGACPAGQYSAANGGCSTNFATACYAAFGSLVGAKTCAIGGYGFGLLTPDNPVGYGAIPVMSVPVNTVISFNGTGGWSANNQNSTSILGGLFNISWGTWNNWSGYQVDLNGSKSGTPLTNAGLPAGLLASDGTEVFLIGSSLPSRTLSQGGMLRMGFNIPMGSYANSYTSYVTGSFSGQLYITVP